LDRPRHDGADDAIDAIPAFRAHPGSDDGGAEQGPPEGKTSTGPEEEGVAAQGAEEGEEDAAACEGSRAREAQAQAGTPAPPLADLDDTPREWLRRSRGTFFTATKGSVVRCWWLTLLLGACAGPGTGGGDLQGEITALLAHSAAAWTGGDLDGFMSDYARDSLTSYISGGHVQYGWQPLYDRYRTAYFAPGKSHDSLSFGEVHARLLAPSVALCTARFALHRGDSVVASGPFTLILARRGGRWVIVHDHTSADPK